MYTNSRAFAPIGTMLMCGNDDAVVSPYSPETFTQLAEVQTIQRSGSKSDLVDVTNMQSTGGYREKLATLRDGGEVSFTANYIPDDTTQISLQTLFDDATLRNWEIVLPQGKGQWNFAAYVSSNDYDLPFDKEGKISAKLTITGKPTFVPGS
jgi:predicted secreted protein